MNGQIFASPVVFDGKVYVESTGGVFNALGAKDGKTFGRSPRDQGAEVVPLTVPNTAMVPEVVERVTQRRGLLEIPASA